MGLFGKLLSKETCCICGNEVGATKRKRLSDGVVCKDCAKKLSPWFDAYKESTEAEVKGQYATREGTNRQFLQELFSISRSFGDFGAILIDDVSGYFCAIADTSESLFGDQVKITSAAQLLERNPDLLERRMVADVDLEIVETRNEEKRTVDGEQVSYNPERWTYSYMFYAVILLPNHPWAKRLRVQLNNGAVRIRNEGQRLRNRHSVGRAVAEWLLDAEITPLEDAAAVYDDNTLWAQVTRSRYQMPDYAYGFKCTMANWEDIQRYGYYLAMGKQIRDALMAR